MNEQHNLRLSETTYAGGLRIVECESCDYKFAAEVNEHGLIQMGSKVPINYGDLHAFHTYFQAPDEPPELRLSAGIEGIE